MLLAAAALGRQLSVSLSLASQCHLLCQGGGHLHPHTIAGQEVSQKYACTGVFTIHTPLQVQGKWANITLSGCSNIVKISCFWFMLLVNLLSFIYFCFNEILFYFRWIQISICFLLLLQQKYFMRKINIKGRDRDTKFCQSFKWRPKISKD